MITHIVCFKFQEPVAENTRKVRELLLGMEGKVPQLRHLEVGVDILRSPRSYDLALITKFDTLADLDAYQVHPLHVEVANIITTVRESSIAVDFES